MSRVSIAMASALERRASINSSYLRSGSALFSTQEIIDPQLFRRFVSELRLDSDYRGAEGIGWARRIGADEVPALERRLSAYRVGPVEITPSLSEMPRDRLVPVTLLQPDTARNRRAIGYDMYSDPVRRAAMDEAERLLRPTASGRVTLKQEIAGTAAGFVIYMPVFENARGQRRVKGFVYSPFSAQDFLSSAAELVDIGDFSVVLYDGANGGGSLMGQINGEDEPRSSTRQAVAIANRNMTVEISSSRSNALSSLSMITLIFGLAVASLLMLVSRLLTRQALEDQRSLDWFAEQNSIRDSLTRELNHRVKNTLANVLSIVALTRRRATNIDDFADGLDGRIRALSATHDLLTQSEWGTTPIASVVAAELAPYMRAEDHGLEVDGPPVELAPNDALSLGLALHELATNASKYGALSEPGGSVSIVWTQTADKLARLEWIESGGPPVAPPRGRGFGTDLIEKIVAHELRHPVELKFDPQGVRCTLVVPIREPVDFAIRAGRKGMRGH
ncbi:CHASE domain-containing protein [Qipengyuania spongiae]|uniref:histidine kinase n=1 Tax=Qipengyuania spongiae TaxID=2909673 RepID=A0ABY5T298_9SPHN|nr:CHASE domain-containing protein [Qipengyuania spongiae]UVI40550.1 CHASE domain-containing protein [Qipengyuania spongiae]